MKLRQLGVCSLISLGLFACGGKVTPNPDAPIALTEPTSPPVVPAADENIKNCPAPNAIVAGAFAAIKDPESVDLEEYLEKNSIDKTARNERCETMFMYAIRVRNDGDRNFLESHGLGAPLDQVDEKLGMSADDYALAYGDILTIKDFQERKNPEGSNRRFSAFSEDAFMKVLATNSKDVIAWILSSAKLNLDFNPNQNPMSAIHLAIAKGRSKSILEMLIKAGAVTDIPNWRDRFDSPLQLAVKSGNRDAAELLLKAKVRAERGGAQSRKVIFSAVDLDRADLVKLLGESGVNLNSLEKSNKSGKFITPLEYAIQNGKTAAAEWLIALGGKRAKVDAIYQLKCQPPVAMVATAFAIVAGQDNRDLGEYLKTNLIAKSAPNANCEPLYMAAIRASNLAAVQILEENGYGYPADEQVADVFGVSANKGLRDLPELYSTPADQAVKFGNVETIQAFEKKANRDQIYISSANEIMWIGNWTVQALLLAIHCNPNDVREYLIEKYKCTEYDCAKYPQVLFSNSVAANRLEWAKHYLENGATVNGVSEMDPWNVTPLMHSARGGSIEMIQFLLEKGANKSLVSQWGTNAYQVAVAEKRPQAILDLLKP